MHRATDRRVAGCTARPTGALPDAPRDRPARCRMHRATDRRVVGCTARPTGALSDAPRACILTAIMSQENSSAGRAGVSSGELVRLLCAQEGKPYVFGAEVSPDDPDPATLDCSEILEWACARLGVVPRVPDGSWLQYRHCARAGLAVDVARALRTRGALLFSFSSDPEAGGRPDRAHVAVSLGNGHTVEARGVRHGVGVFPPRQGWTHAAFLPGVEYPPFWRLRPGDRGEDVRALQALLGGLALDGAYGPLTEAAVRYRQVRAGLVPNGEACPALLREISA
jgi:cell wall-associated NlpC family hydrolase